jgi:hypothetical protein
LPGAVPPTNGVAAVGKGSKKAPQPPSPTSSSDAADGSGKTAPPPPSGDAALYAAHHTNLAAAAEPLVPNLTRRRSSSARTWGGEKASAVLAKLGLRPPPPPNPTSSVVPGAAALPGSSGMSGANQPYPEDGEDLPVLMRTNSGEAGQRVLLTSAVSTRGMIGGACILLSQHSNNRSSNHTSRVGATFSQLLTSPFNSSSSSIHYELLPKHPP